MKQRRCVGSMLIDWIWLHLEADGLHSGHPYFCKSDWCSGSSHVCFSSSHQGGCSSETRIRSTLPFVWPSSCTTPVQTLRKPRSTWCLTWTTSRRPTALQSPMPVSQLTTWLHVVLTQTGGCTQSFSKQDCTDDIYFFVFCQLKSKLLAAVISKTDLLLAASWTNSYFYITALRRLITVTMSPVKLFWVKCGSVSLV